MFREYAPRIYNLARRMLGNDADAEDVTQDVLLQVVRKLDTFRGESQIATWLHRVTVNAAVAHRQKRATRQQHEGGEADETTRSRPRRPASTGTSPPDEPVLAAEQAEVIEQAIQIPARAVPRRVRAGGRGRLAERGDRGDAGAVGPGGQEPVAPGEAADAGRAGPALRGEGDAVNCEELFALLHDYVGGELVVEVRETFEVYFNGCERGARWSSRTRTRAGRPEAAEVRLAAGGREGCGDLEAELSGDKPA